MALDSPQDYWEYLKLTFNLTAENLIYRNAHESLQANPQITSLVGHYIAGSVILEMQNNYPDITFKTTTCGAPVKSTTMPDKMDNQRFRNIGDPISIIDRGATSAVKPSLLQNVSSIIPDTNSINTKGVALQALDNHSSDGFGKQLYKILFGKHVHIKLTIK
jgi:hypothetical protein